MISKSNQALYQIYRNKDAIQFSWKKKKKKKNTGRQMTHRGPKPSEERRHKTSKESLQTVQRGKLVDGTRVRIQGWQVNVFITYFKTTKKKTLFY